LVRILAIADLHENIDTFKDIISLTNFDMLILAGDLSELRVLEFYEVLKQINKPIVLINGNHDCCRCFDRIAKKLDFVHYIHRGEISIEVDGEEFLVVGISGIYGKRREPPLYFSDNHLIKLISSLQKEDVKADILISHTPPYRAADFLPKGGRGGLKQFLALMDLCEPKYWIAGHTHVLAAEKRGETIIINCGLGYIGDFALIDTRRDRVVISRLFIEYIDIDENAEWNFVYMIRRTRSIRRLLEIMANKISALNSECTINRQE